MGERVRRLRAGMRRFATRDLPILLGLFAVMFAVMAFSGKWPMKRNTYNSYALQASSWLEGRLDLKENYAHLELAEYDGKYYVSFPPFPSVVLLPFCAIFGTDTPDNWIALAVTALGVLYALRLCRRVAPKATLGRVTLLTLFFFLSNGYVFIGVLGGWVWYLAQCLCITLSLMALCYAFEGKGTPSLACWACAVGCRPMVAVYLPLLAYMLCRAHGQKPLPLLRRRWYWVICPAVIAGFYMALNYARFGSITEFGHTYLPEFMSVQTGQFHPSYILQNLRDIMRLPAVGEEGKLSFFKFNGMAVWMLSPMFVVALAAWLCAAIRRGRENLFTLIAVPVMAALHLVILLMHKTMGGWHFGNRYLLDIMPYLLYGILCWMPQSEVFDLWCLPPALLGAAINLIGTVATYNSWI